MNAWSDFLKEQGFEVTTPVADMDTAYVGVYGSGKPVICFLAEYDALHGMSQEADVCCVCSRKRNGSRAMAAAIIFWEQGPSAPRCFTAII